MTMHARAAKTASFTPSIQPRGSSGAGPPSRWVCSRAKRWFDIALVLAAVPIAAPVCLVIAIAIRVTSHGPILFRQTRIGRNEKRFSIMKFRTMRHSERAQRGSITTIADRQITPVGRLLRRWKLDELPQLVNVLRGEMSLVGPRPRVPEQPIGRIDCLPGITGAASLAFAREEVLLAHIPRRELDTYYARRVIPLKQRLDAAYMTRATFSSDLRLIFLSVFRVCITANDGPPAADLPGERRGSMGIVLPGEGCD